MKPKLVTMIDMVCGPNNISAYLPKETEIPNEFKEDNNKWVKIIKTWFFKGLPKKTVFIPKDEIDKSSAISHISCVLRSFDPSHEHKISGCAYLLSCWFEDVLIPVK
jgi:hypothetical protein